MKRPSRILSLVGSVSLCLLVAQKVHAQGYGTPLTIQGLDHTTQQSAASRAAGGVTMGIQNDVGLMFSNPASLQSLKAIQVSLGGMQRYTKTAQVQQYGPLKYYSNFSLLMEGLTGYIPNPDTSIPGRNPGDTVQRPYDTIGPNWSHSKNSGQFVQALVGVPFSVGDMQFAVGAGTVQYANLRLFYQNNNVLSPAILSVRPSPFPLPSNVSTLDARWSQYTRSRDGIIHGYGGALSGAVTEELSLGVSGMVLKGSTDDVEQHTGRGNLTFYANYFRLDSVYSHTVRTGTSDYSGSEFTFSAIYRGKHVTLGISAKPPMTITRKYAGQLSVDTTGTPTITPDAGQDKMRLPWRGTVGLSIAVRENVQLGFEYEVKSYAQAKYTDASGTASNPWLSSDLFHVGAEYIASPWLILRAGVRGQAEMFEPEGNPIEGDPVTYSIYSAGCGLLFGSARLNITYEYAPMKYQDVWASAISLNNDTRHTIVADISYDIPWGN